MKVSSVLKATFSLYLLQIRDEQVVDVYTTEFTHIDVRFDEGGE